SIIGFYEISLSKKIDFFLLLIVFTIKIIVFDNNINKRMENYLHRADILSFNLANCTPLLEHVVFSTNFAFLECVLLAKKFKLLDKYQQTNIVNYFIDHNRIEYIKILINNGFSVLDARFGIDIFEKNNVELFDLLYDNNCVFNVCFHPHSMTKN